MIVAKLDDNQYITQFEFATLADYTSRYYPKDNTWVFVDRPMGWSNDDYAYFMRYPNKHYVGLVGELSRDYTLLPDGIGL